MSRKIDELRYFLSPRSIAIIGASSNFDSISGKPARFLREHGYEGQVYPVNPKYNELMGYKCYKSILDVPGDVDLALIAVNFKLVLPMLKECVAKGVRFASIFSSGFAESGEEGRAMQVQIAALAKESGMGICGPNCQGSVALRDRAVGGFSASLGIKPLIPGPIGYVTQSGALGYSIFSLAQEAGVGFSYVASTGNEVDLHAMDFMEFMLEDDETRMVIAYLEGIKNGKQFARLADRALELGKPIVALKVGRSEVGRKAASSHTGSLTGSDAVCDAFFRQKGIIRAGDIEGMIDIAMLMQRTRRIPRGTGLGIITTSGGAGILAADAAVDVGLQVPALGEETTAIIEKLIPSYGSALNPVDVTGQVINTAHNFQLVLRAMLAHPSIDALIIVVTQIAGESGMQVARDVVALSKECDKPIGVAWPTSNNLVGGQLKVLSEGGVFVVKSPVRAVVAMGSLMKYGRFQDDMAARKISAAFAGPSAGAVTAARAILESGEGALSEHDAKEVLRHFDIPVPQEDVVGSAAEAVAIAERIGYPVVLKIDSPDIPHKTEARALKLNLRSKADVAAAFTEVMANARAYKPDARINGVTIREMIEGGTEVIVGVNNDPQFGPTLMFGLGGIFVEILKDVALRVAPVSREDALAMIGEIKGHGILAGARGRAKADIEAIADVLVKVSRMAMALEDLIAEVDINPLLVLAEGQGVRVADALIVRKKNGAL